VEGKVLFIDKDFFEYLYLQFSLAVGPVAEVLIEDEVQDLGYDLSQFPTQRIAELIDRLSRNIRREEKKNTFTKNMINKIGEKRYFNT
ncbi:MAG: hypothetical protein PVG87_20290, partial [Desulfobacteraceae bacterium]